MSATTINDNIFRKYDIRGIYPTDLNPQVAYQIGMGYGTYIKQFIEKDAIVAVGHDARTHSPIITESLIKGLTDVGVKVLDIGMCPTPVLYFSNFIDQTNYKTLLNLPPINGGIMVTGSHNPPEYNGFKMLINKIALTEEDILEIKKIVKSGNYAKSEPENFIKMELNSTYREYLWSQFSPLKNLRVVIDSANGTAGLVVPILLKKLGCEVIQLFTKPDGTFPFHHPDPTIPKNMELLASIVKDNLADLGIGYDGDSDRLGIVSPSGKIIWGDDLMIIFAKEMIKEALPDEKLSFIGEVKCSQRMYDFIESLGANVIMSKTGHTFIKKKMNETGAKLACEMSGHVFFADKYFGFDDAIYATLRILEIISKYKTQKGYSFIIDDLLSNVPNVTNTPEIRVPSTDEKKFKVIENIENELSAIKEEHNIKDIITIDGLRIIFENGFALVRASNTEPILVTRFEAKSFIQLENYKKLVNDLIEKFN